MATDDADYTIAIVAIDNDVFLSRINFTIGTASDLEVLPCITTHLPHNFLRVLNGTNRVIQFDQELLLLFFVLKLFEQLFNLLPCLHLGCYFHVINQHALNGSLSIPPSRTEAVEKSLFQHTIAVSVPISRRLIPNKGFSRPVNVIERVKVNLPL